MKSSEPLWSMVPSDEEILLARSVLRRMSHAVPIQEDEVWGGLVEARRMLTISVHYLSGWAGHTRHYRRLWNHMLEQDQ